MCEDVFPTLYYFAKRKWFTQESVAEAMMKELVISNKDEINGIGDYQSS